MLTIQLLKNGGFEDAGGMLKCEQGVSHCASLNDNANLPAPWFEAPGTIIKSQLENSTAYEGMYSLKLR